MKRYTPDEETLEGMREVERGEYILYTDHIAEMADTEFKRAMAQAAWDSLLLANDRQCQYIGDAQAILETLKDYQGTGYPGVRELLAKRPMDYTPTIHRIRDLVEENLRLRDKILEVCAECSTCDGTGLITISVDDREVVHAMDKPIVKTEPCEDCADLREVLGQ